MILTLKPIRRHYVTGLSKGPQGADAVAILAREAYLAMLAAPWSDDAREAMMPVHEYDRDPPEGQAFKGIWGYDKTARVEQASCGAECYSYKIPADALDGTNADGVATVMSARVRIAGDRYLDKGVCIWCELSSSATPAPIALAIASGTGAAYLATQNQVNEDGSAVAPNKRRGGEETVAIPVDSAPSQYLHVHLYLSDYLGVRDAWIEGGAMFAADGVDIQFSRDVGIVDADTESGYCALDVGLADIGDSSGQVSAPYAVQHLPRVALWSNYAIQAQAPLAGTSDAPGALSNDFGRRVRDLLAFIYSPPNLWSSAESGKLAATTEIGYAGTVGANDAGLLRISSNRISFCCLCVHGLTSWRTFRGLRFATALPDAIPYRLLVYGISGDVAIMDANSGSTFRYSTPLAYWADVLSRTFRDGTATTLRVMADSTLADEHMSTATDDKTADIGVQPLAARDVSSSLDRVEFDAPFRSGELSSIILALIPNGAPTDVETTVDPIAATATRAISAVFPVSAVRGARQPYTVTGTITFQVGTNVEYDIPTAMGGLSFIHTSYPALWQQDWKDSLKPTYTLNNRTAQLVGLNITLARDGKTFVYNTANGDPVPDFSFPCTLTVESPARTYFPIKFQYAGNPSGTISFVAHTADTGETVAVVADLNGQSTVRFRNNGGAEDIRLSDDIIYTFDNAWGYISAQDVYWRNPAYVDPARNYDDNSAGVCSVRNTPEGYAYSFESSANETAMADVTQSGTVTFERGGVIYSASFSATDTAILGIGSKTTGVRITVGSDATETATATGNVSEIAMRLLFNGSDGSTLWADVSFPSAQIKGDIPYQAKSAYAGAVQGVGTVFNDGADTGSGAAYRVGLQGTATVREAFAEAHVNPGLVTLYE